MSATYSPRCFDVRNIAEAKAIILTPDFSTTDERWTKETPYLADLMGEYLGLKPFHRVLDYGCGIGRMSKALIEQFGCSVVGVDLSVSMRALACAYVDSDRFVACAPNGEMLVAGINKVHHAIAVWSLQHIPAVEASLNAIRRQMMWDGRLLVVNAHHRCLPIEGGRWIDDGMDMREQLSSRFKEIAYGPLDPLHTSPDTAKHAYFGVYQNFSR